MTEARGPSVGAMTSSHVLLGGVTRGLPGQPLVVSPPAEAAPGVNGSDPLVPRLGNLFADTSAGLA